MKFPFDAAAFFDVFARYNERVWPAQVFLAALAVGAVLLVLRPNLWSDRAVSAVLALLWVWMAIVYHLGFFRAIKPVATVFALFFLAQGIVLGLLGTWKHELRFRFRSTVAGALGASLVGFALIVYPLLGYSLGRRYPAAPAFGLPCPTTIFTLGVLLWMESPVSRTVFVVPLAWSVVGISAALQIGVVEDFGLGVAGLIAGVLSVVPSLGRTRLSGIWDRLRPDFPTLG